ncbi:MAG TPA: glycosyltransferase family 2 protein [Candidatus Acidoferrales bacterium]|nr:glycosyltransferase family 2 protein [Candidatus Acidoferrales bacterium]
MRSADITFVVLTKDEARNLGDCLRSLPQGAHALVYDAFSRDDTPTLARELGATVAQAPWAGYVAARAAAADLVNTPWTFMLDADERVTIALRDELEHLEADPGTLAYSVPRRNWFCGHWIRCAGWWPDRLVRLFRTGVAQVKPGSPASEAPIHETWHVPGAVGVLSEPLDHFSYPSVEVYRAKFSRYTQIEAQATLASVPAFVRALLLVPARLFWLLLGRGGLSEGWRGAYVCLGSAAYPAAVKAKALALGRKAPASTMRAPR